MKISHKGDDYPIVFTSDHGATRKERSFFSLLSQTKYVVSFSFFSFFQWVV